MSTDSTLRREVKRTMEAVARLEQEFNGDTVTVSLDDAIERTVALVQEERKNECMDVTCERTNHYKKRFHYIDADFAPPDKSGKDTP